MAPVQHGGGIPQTRSGDGLLTFRDVSFTVPTKDGEKTLLSGISGTVPTQAVLAIIGPSGAGKTTLINVLTMDVACGVGTPRGEVLLNGHLLTHEEFVKHSAVVTQNDHHWDFLTCRETIVYASALFHGGAEAEKEADTLLGTLGLTSCADTIVGNQFIQGLSGGQKRRLSIALALIKKPLLLYLDEPTSGLDAAAAAAIMKSIKELVHDANMIAVATIHQPSAAVYRGFDQVMVLSLGRMAYLGPADGAEQYFESIGYPAPLHENPAEFMLTLVNCDFTEQETVEKILQEFEDRKKQEPETEIKKFDIPCDVERTTGGFNQFLTLMSRHGKLTYKDPILYLGRCIMFLVATCFFALVYIDARERNQEQALFRLFLIMWMIGVPTSLGVAVVFVSNGEFQAISREVRNGMVSTMPYVCAKAILDIPLMILMALFSVGIAGYAMLDFYAPNFPLYIGLYALTLYSFECAAHFMAIAVPNPLLGMLQFMNIWFTAFLFAGVMVPEEQVIWPLRIFCSVLPLKWALRGMAYIEFSDVTFSGASSCTYVANSTDCLSHDGGATGWQCPAGTDPLLCMGYTGKQVLDSVGMVYRSFSSQNTVPDDLLILAAIALFFKVSYVVVFWIRVHSFVSPQPPMEDGESAAAAVAESA